MKLSCVKRALTLYLINYTFYLRVLFIYMHVSVSLKISFLTFNYLIIRFIYFL